MNYNVSVVGGGPGGYVAAIRAAQLGYKVAVFEKEALGGICLNWGCIPTKSLLKNAEIYQTILKSSSFGINVTDVSFDWKKIISRSRKISKRLSKGIEYLMKKNKIDVYNGYAKIIDQNIIECNKKQFKSDCIIIATGARAKEFLNTPFDNKKIINYKDAMTLEEMPKRISIIGAGAIGVEFAYFYSSFGCKVSIIEAKDRILPSEDIEVSKCLEKKFKERGIDLNLSASINKIDLKKNVSILLDNKSIESDCILVAIGVQGNFENLFSDKMNIQIENSFIKTNHFMQTQYNNIYAIGDVSGPPWLAHVASAEGVLAVEHFSKKDVDPIDYGNIPGCTYCKPEVASIGLTEEQAISEGYNVSVGKFPLSASGKAMAVSSTDGFVKVVYDKKYGELLGFHMIGDSATELVSEIAVARKLEATNDEILKIIHPHPTISEAIVEATADSKDESIHI
tara:strand:+ start:3 stop:1361 length:1359 start_codon:yes stop_codon:yes gene_type:complete